MCTEKAVVKNQTYKNPEHKLGRDSEQIGLESREAHLSKYEREVVLWRLRWNVRGQTNQIERPQVVILQALPQSVERDCLAIVHVALGRVVAKDAIDKDDLLSFVEPPILAAKPPFGLADTRWYQEPGCNADTRGESSFYQEKPCRSLSVLSRKLFVKVTGYIANLTSLGCLSFGGYQPRAGSPGYCRC
jgi:hypothetical protein